MKKAKSFFFWGTVCCCLFCFLQIWYPFYFYYVEQLQVFPLTWACFEETCRQPGGLACWLGGFLLQFYHLPLGGALVSTGLFLGIGVLMQRICRQTTSPVFCYLPALCPILALLPLHVDVNYRLQGTVAYCCMLGAFVLYVRIVVPWKRVLAGWLLMAVLFVLAGPVATLFVAGVVVREMLLREKGWQGCLALPFGIVLMLWWSYRFFWQPEYRMIVLPDFYYEPLLKANKLYWAWLAFLSGLLMACFPIGKGRGVLDRTAWWWTTVQLLPLVAFLGWMKKKENCIWLKNMELYYYVRGEQWDKVVAGYKAAVSDMRTLSLLNLALACQGELGDILFHYPQQGKGGLLPEWNSTVPGAIVLSDICYQMGDLSSAQKFAFEGYVSSVDGNPRLLQRLVQTNILTGAYAVAEKYIRILEQTLFYKEWAAEWRKYLYRDDLVEEEPSLGGKRRAWGKGGQYAVSADLLEVWERLAVNNPDRSVAFQYLLSFHLLGKTLNRFDELHRKYYRTKVWPSLSIHQQEAVIALYQKTPRLWPEKGVGMKVELRYGAFDQDMNTKHGYVNFRDVMAGSYGDTYWFYLMFKK